MTPAVTSECAHIHSEHRCWRRCSVLWGELITTFVTSQRSILFDKIVFKMNMHSFQKRPGLIVSACWNRTSSRNGHFAPSLAASAFGSDQDYQIDIISELDLANATYGITQVAGLHNNSKAFLFRGNARTLACTHARTHDGCFHRSSGPSLSPASTHAGARDSLFH